MSAVRVGFALARERARGIGLPIAFALTACGVFVAGVLERRSSASTATDDVLSGVVFGLVVPVLAYLVSQRVSGGQRLDQCVEGVARYGASRRAAALGVLLFAALLSACASALLTLLALLGTRAPAADLRVSLGIAFAAGLGYSFWLGAASLVGKRGGGRKWALILDFVLGAGSSFVALWWPRAHVRNLLGGEPALDLSQRAAWIALGLIVLGSGIVTTRLVHE